MRVEAAVARCQISFGLIALTAISYAQVSTDFKSVEATTMQIAAKEGPSERYSRVLNLKDNYQRQKDIKSAFMFMSGAYRLLDEIDSDKALTLKKQAYDASNGFKLRDRYFTGVRVGLAVDTFHQKEVILDSHWLMLTFPDQPFFKYRYLQCAVCAEDARKNSKQFLEMSASLVKGEPNNARYVILDAFLTGLFAQGVNDLKSAATKFERSLTLKLTESQKEYVNRHLQSTRNAIRSGN